MIENNKIPLYVSGQYHQDLFLYRIITFHTNNLHLPIEKTVQNQTAKVNSQLWKSLMASIQFRNPTWLKAGIILDIFFMPIDHKWTTFVMAVTAINHLKIPLKTGQQSHHYPISCKSDLWFSSELSASSTLANMQSFLSHPASQWTIVCFVNITGHSSKELFYAFDLHYKHKGLSSMWPEKAASSKRLWKLLPGESVKKGREAPP